MEILHSALAATPFYVWVLFVILVLAASTRLDRRERHIRALLIVPLAFLAIAIQRAVTLDTSAGAAAMAAGAAAGFTLVLALRPERKVVAIDNNRVTIDGEWYSLLVVVFLFAALYAGNVIAAVDPAFARTAMVQIPVNFVIGMAVGFSVCRSAAYVVRALSLRCHEGGITLGED
ncbi:hypothetical protein [Martelella radicis]|uniref:4-amino-4-deoxy-L-arabinose transferase-like glycosyltransferase n=1 Tax=Martelella radicis TaxID=1397476 RepID=A0A7W6P897_9HYPH|nr:hypothetical protein [Martelella radicis]MBB4121012.1 4-amino-4-deoxy-L-arabinose transferase-like glycosyltransferase [Martelella radicis]